MTSNLPATQHSPLPANPEQLPSFLSGPYTTVRYNGMLIKHSYNHSICNGLFLPIGIKYLFVSDLLYFSTHNNIVYSTDNMSTFNIIGHGTLLGLFGSFAVIFDQSIYLINHNLIRDYLYIYKIKGLIYYCISDNKSINNEYELITISESLTCLYLNYLIIGFNNELVLIKLSASQLTSDLLNQSSDKLNQPNKSVKQHEMQPVSQHYKLSGTIQTISKLNYNGIPFVEIHDGIKVCYLFDCWLINDIVDRWEPASWYMSLDVLEQNIISKMDRSTIWNIITNNTNKIRNISKFINHEMHKMSGPTEFIKQYSSMKYSSQLESIKQLTGQSFFYQPFISTMETNKMMANLETNKMIAGSEWLERKYSRIFNFIPEINKSANLAYWIIRKELRKDKQIKKKQFVIKNKLIFKMCGDKRIDEIIKLMDEVKIKILQDVTDVDNIRQKYFISRVVASSALVFLGMVPAFELSQPVVMINETGIREKLTDGMQFIVSAGYNKISDVNDIPARLGMIFGNGLCKSITDKEMQECIEQLRSIEYENHIPYLLLVLATRRNSWVLKREALYNTKLDGYTTIIENEFTNSSLNQIFIGYLSLEESIGPKELEAKSAAVVALGIYNSNSGNKIIHEYLIKESIKTGPTDQEKSICFYDRNYRLTAALSAALVSNVRSPIRLADSYSELIINGMSFIDKKYGSFSLKRDDTCRCEEIFLSELFILLNSFQRDEFEILESVELINGSGRKAHVMAARVFYVALKWIRDGKDGKEQRTKQDKNKIRTKFYSSGFKYKKISTKMDKRTSQLLEMALKLEEMNESDPGILFTYCLVAASIIQHSTMNLSLLRILRRRILMTHDLANSTSIPVFGRAAKTAENCYLPSFKTIQFYKLAISLTIAGFGVLSFRNELVTCRQLIITFFIEGSSLADFTFLDVLRLVSLRQLEVDGLALNNYRKACKAIARRRRSKKIMKKFKKEISKMDEIDRKFVYDVLSDYYENYHHKTSKKVLFDLLHLAKAISIMK